MTPRRLTIIILLPLLASLTMKGQRVMQWEEFMEFLTTNEDWADQQDWGDYVEELQQLHLHPLNINTATPQQLRHIPFLSERQIEQIVQYRDYHHGMHSLNELILLTSISYQERQYLPLFFYVDEAEHADTNQGDTLHADGLKETWKKDWKKSWQYRQNEFATRIDIPLYHRRGYLIQKGYRGSPLYNKAYYRMVIPGHFAAGIKMERDAGERGIDSYGAYLYLQDMPLSHTSNGLRLTSLATGDYKIAFGQGLVLNQGFGMGKWNTALQRKSQGIRPARSTDESNFMRGIATTLSLPHISLSVFYSHRKWDATLNASEDKDSPSTVKTIVKDGYHRTELEYNKKGVLSVDAMGGNLTWHRGGWRTGLTGYYQQTDRTLEPGTTTYRRFYPQGNRFGALGANYSYEAYRWNIFGETAHNGQHHGIATLNGVSWRPSARYTITALQRYYNYHYYSFYSSALSECGAVQNETGGMLRLDASPWDGVQLAAYMDVFYNPWPRYGLKKSSGGWDAMTDGACQITRRSTIKIRYNIKQKEQSDGLITDHRLRLQWLMSSPNEQWHFTHSAMFHTQQGSYGEALGSMVKYEVKTKTRPKNENGNEDRHGIKAPKEGVFSFTVNGIYFHTDDYDSRIYLYEANVSEMTYIPSFSGHGVRASSIVRCQLWDKLLTLELKYGITRYFDRDKQGSSLQTIYSAVKNDITVQAKVKI